MENLKLAQEILKIINSYGYEAYIVGGAVRDYLLEKPLNDIDIATSMPIDILAKVFNTSNDDNNYLSIIINYKDCLFEITLFRKDINYIDHRHPEVMLVNTFLEDSYRRDFTINALAFDYNLNIYDYHNGLSDLKNKIIRTINNPLDRFEEDSLRILRCLYFSSKLNFEIEKETLSALKEKKHLLAYLSNNRIYDYFVKIVNSESDLGIEYIKKYDLFLYIPDFKNWLEVVHKNYSCDEMALAYYLNNHKLPCIYTKQQKKLIMYTDEIIKEGFSKLILFKYQNEYYQIRRVLKDNGFSINKYDADINDLCLKKESDLALKKEWFVKHFEGKKIKENIDRTLSAILEGKIDNNKEEIINYLNGSK